ncbi:MAG: hypothetical protein E7291_09425 [Lachnospiraceae bacterium]|nr:hypothetical protein [Lachnospiraceae bacterium]
MDEGLYMKRIGNIIVLLFCLLAMTACGKEEVDEEKIYQVYYVSNSETKVEMHDYVMQSEDTEEQLEELIQCLSTMPDKLKYKAPLAMGFQVLSMKLEEEKLLLNVDAAYSNLSPTTEVLVRAAIVHTLIQIEGINYVGITVEGNQLFDNAGEVVSWMNADTFINNDGNEINTYELARLKLYFANESGDRLVASYREKHYSTNVSMERLVVEELIAGPTGQIEGMYPAINPQTKIINVMTKDGICYVNLDATFLTVVNNVSTEVAIYSMVNSLVELSNVNKVQIMINGEVPSTFATATYERNLDYVTTLGE